MKTNVLTEINKIRELSKDKDEYIRIIAADLILDPSIIETIQKHNYKYNLYQASDDPEVRLIIELGSFSDSKFQIEYWHNIVFSKFAKFYKESFSYKIKNHDPDSILGDFYSTIYRLPTRNQFNYYEEIKLILNKNSYEELEARDYDEVLCDMEFVVKEMTFFGPQPTVDMVLFKDFFDLTE